jgi:hypothetical protein
MKRRSVHILLLAVLFLGLAALAIAWTLHSSRVACENLIAELQSCGESFDIKTLTPAQSESPSATAFIEAAEEISNLVKASNIPKSIVNREGTHPGVWKVGHKTAGPEAGNRTLTWEDVDTSIKILQVPMETAVAAALSGNLTVHPDYTE